MEGFFKKKLNLIDLTFLGLGSIIGSGWLLASMNGAKYAGSIAWVAWIGGAIAVLLIGLVYGELAAALPRAGGICEVPGVYAWFAGRFFVGDGFIASVFQCGRN